MFDFLTDSIKRRWRRIKRGLADFRIPRLLSFDFYWQIFTWPFGVLITGWQAGRIRNLMLGLPAILGMVIVGYLGGKCASANVASKYWAWAQADLTNKNYPKAQLELDRIIKENLAHVEDARFAQAMMYDELGETERAAALFGVLAPDNSLGFPEAHRRLALLLSREITNGSSKNDLERLHWHLKSGRLDSTPGMALAWGRYSIAVRDLVSARKYFRIAVNEHAEVWKLLGDIEAAFGNEDAARTGYAEASNYLSNEIRNNPGNNQARVDYADALVRLGRLNEAKVLIEEGQRIAPEEEATWNQILAALYVNFHDLMSLNGKSSVGDLLQPLGESLDHDPNFGPALNRLMSYAKANVEGNLELRAVLSRTVAEGKKPALAHLALGNLCWLEGDAKQAFFHFERARKIDSELSIVMNNLAWLIAHDEENPDLDQALALVNEALLGRPDNLQFLDTRGTIFFLKEDWKKALDDLERAIEGVHNKQPVHAKLAQIYEKLDLPEIAKQHRLLADSAQPK